MIALKLRRPSMNNEYLYPQIFTGVSYVVASVFLLELRRVIKKRDSNGVTVSSLAVTDGPQTSHISTDVSEPSREIIVMDSEQKIG